MSLNRVMGYGMSWSRFQELCKLPLDGDDDEELWEVVYNTFSGLKTSDMEMTKEDKEKYGDDKLQPSIFSLNALQNNLSIGKNGPPKTYGAAIDLVHMVMMGDRTTDIVFLPNLLFGKSWYRSQDSLDATFEELDREGDDNYPRSFTKYARNGFYPYHKYFMNEKGEPVEGDLYVNNKGLAEENNVFGAIPGDMRWYLTKHKVLDNEGVNELRPVISQWWT